jgi:hypothetical protein
VRGKGDVARGEAGFGGVGGGEGADLGNGGFELVGEVFGVVGGGIGEVGAKGVDDVEIDGVREAVGDVGWVGGSGFGHGSICSVSMAT